MTQLPRSVLAVFIFFIPILIFSSSSSFANGVLNAEHIKYSDSSILLTRPLGLESEIILLSKSEQIWKGSDEQFELKINTFEGLHVLQYKVDGDPSSLLFRISNKNVQPFNSWLSLLPPLLAILLALVFKEVVISLFLGSWLGVWIVGGFSFKGVFSSLFTLGDTYLLDVLKDGSHISVILFTLFIGGTVSIIYRSGGMSGVVDRISSFASSARRTQFATWLMGLVIFFDDYANTLIVGNTMRPVSDKWKISREKLAYIVDSTAAPVAAIAFITTWVGAELGYIEGALSSLDLDKGAYQVFLSSLKYAYYPILAIVFILILIVLKVDFGPMSTAERKARKGEAILINSGENKDFDIPEGTSIWLPIIPILVIVLGTVCGMIYTGILADSSVLENGDQGLGQKMSTIIGNSDSFSSLIWASMLGFASAVILSAGFKTISLRESIESGMEGFKSMLPALVIMILAWCLAEVAGKLYTGEVLSSFFSSHLNAIFLPEVTFLLAGAIAFSTGSSWGTMAILYPLMIPAAWLACSYQGIEAEAAWQIIYAVTSAVLAGSVFGDHCSPISDTTILSSLSTSCDHISHVRTQLPYALTVAAVCIVCYMLDKTGSPSFLNLGIGVILLYLIAKYFGKPNEEVI